ncbi:MAG: hypothetical protein Q9Q40_02795 [Acidobacteriota bacterium]|nr:hypothetical protein [Acidobacteriota bacterium]MDQ7088854.1 hypothetical protein [Acidobacteriota bacterium]
MPARLSRQQKRDRFRRRVRAALKRADEAFKGKYRDAIDQLSGLSREEIDAIAPGGGGYQAYNRLLAVVQEASRLNVTQAELRSRIEALGEVAIRIAGKVPRLAAIVG